jgi:hypothetical protein
MHSRLRYTRRTKMVAVRRSRKRNIFKNDARFLARRVTMWLSVKIIDTPVNGRPSLLDIDSVHQMETSLSYALLDY